MPLVTTAEQVAATTVRYSWSGTAPFDVWLNGECLLRQTTATAFTVEYNGEGAEPWIEVLDATDVDPAASEAHSPRTRLQWRGQADANFYRVQRFNEDTEEWEDRQFVTELGRGYLWSTTTPEVDGTTPQWRVLAEDARGYTSEVVAISRRIVCNPRTPVVAGSYDANTGELTVDE